MNGTQLASPNAGAVARAVAVSALRKNCPLTPTDWAVIKRIVCHEGRSPPCHAACKLAIKLSWEPALIRGAFIG